MNEFLDRIYADKYEDALEFIKSNPSQFKEYNEFDNQQAWVRIVRNKQFALLDFMIENNMIETDVYEYDSIQRSVFDSLLKNISDDEASLAYLKSFIKKLDNINDEVAGETLLSYALSEKVSPAIIRALIDAGCSPQFRNTAQNNLLIEAIRLNMIPSERQLAYLKIFTDEGIDVNEGNVERKNALHHAVESHKKDLIPYLLEQRADATEQDWKGNTAFHLAFLNTDDDIIIPQLLGSQAPDFESENKDGEKPLGVFMRYMNGSERSIRNLDKIIDAGADMNQTSTWYSRPKSGWDWVVEKKPEVLEAVFAKVSPDVNMQDNDGNTLLHKVCSIDCNYSQETAKDIYRKAKFLLKEGADATAANNKDETPVMIASKDNLKTKTVEILLKINK